jgi:CDP-glycerol glycerophosphotransferase (TagB/SpsB family)
METAKNLQKQPRYKDNVNPYAKIGFIIFYPFQFYVQKNIYEHIKNESEFIVDLGAFFPVEQPSSLVMDIVTLLEKHKVFFRIIYHEDYFYAKYLESFFSKYKVLISLWGRGCVKLNCNLGKRKVVMPYGAGKELTTFGLWKRDFDLILAYGERDHNFYSLLTQSQIIGNPKFDDWFKDELDYTLTTNLKKRLDSGKKNVVYLPTHSDLGSIDDLADQLKALTDEYNVLVKLHYYTVREEKERVEKLKHGKIILLNDDTDLLPLLKLADVVVSDNSSAIFDVILADKPIVTTDFLSKEYLDKTHREIKNYRRGANAAITYSNSIEQKIKKEKQVLTLKSPSELKEQVETALRDDLFYKEARKKIREQVFSFNDGLCGKRGAQAITSLLEQRKLPEKPLLYHLLDNLLVTFKFKNNSFRKSYFEEVKMNKKSLLEELKEEKKDTCIFSVILINQPWNNKYSKITLKSLFLQEFNNDNFEIILENKGDNESIPTIAKEISLDMEKLPAIKYIEKQVSDSDYIKNCVDNAKGEFLCFIKNGCLAPSDWLLKFYLSYQKHLNIAGVGGYVIKQMNKYSIFDEYYYLELANQMNTQKEENYMSKIYEIKNNLFYQNPAGSFTNSSYKKEILQNISVDFNDSPRKLIEMEIKNEVIKDYEICFINSFVSDFEKITLKKFIRNSFNEGISYALFCIENPLYNKYYKYSILRVVWITISNIFNRHLKWELTSVVFIGNLFRLFGKWYLKLGYSLILLYKKIPIDFNKENEDR